MTGVNWMIGLITLPTFVTGLVLLQVLRRQYEAKNKAVLKPVPIRKRQK
ncbi:MAG: hypothetical protein H6662_05460 [Ardenticatenaceae bacterium]|nr:hypothetical protein [Ardenticatenaceae bacterium]MCB9004190.1 hypothetical protein [Ardenticatenaceae bacterium]